MDNESTAVVFEDFSFKYDAQSEPTLKNINLTVRRGEKIILAGPSGCGKSTLANCINGLVPFSYRGEMTGSVRIFGRETSEMSIAEISRYVGTVLQDSDNQFIGLTVGEDISFAMENDCVDQDTMKARALAAAGEVGVQDHILYSPQELSGGQKQRVSIAGVLVDEVPILLFDEPLANLDPATGKSAMVLIERIRKEKDAAVIIIEHRLEDALYCGADRIVLMNDGRITADLPPDEMLCSSHLNVNRIREPLYITALKYAGVELRPDMKVSSVKDIQISEENKIKVHGWMESVPRPAEKPERQRIVSLKDVSFTYPTGKKALSDVSLDIKKGEMLSLVGKNGAGKSTLAKVICGFEDSTEGSILISGRDASEMSIKERAMHIGYVMQNPNSMLSKTMIADEVAWGLIARGMSKEQASKRSEEMLKVCGLYEYRNWPVGALSYGQKKRVTIASILVYDPEMIILDEPTAGQDLGHYTEIMDFLKDVNSRGVTILMITHDMHLMLEYCERSVVLLDGRIIADDKPENILTDRDLIEKAALKETSLYGLAIKCGIDDAGGFVGTFINDDRRKRGHE